MKKSLEECIVHVPLSRRNPLGLTSEEKEVITQKNRAKGEWNRWKRNRNRRKYRELEREVRDIVVSARKRILEQVENGSCWQLLQALGRGGGYPNAPLRDGDTFVFWKEENGELAATFLEEVFKN